MCNTQMLDKHVFCGNMILLLVLGNIVKILQGNENNGIDINGYVLQLLVKKLNVKMEPTENEKYMNKGL